MLWPYRKGLRPRKLGMLLFLRLALLLKDRRCQSSKMLLLSAIAVFFGTCFAQRPQNTSLCDYYAESLYGTNSNVTQLRLMESIVTLAFAGPFTIPNVSSELTGMYCLLKDGHDCYSSQKNKASGIPEHTMDSMSICGRGSMARFHPQTSTMRQSKSIGLMLGSSLFKTS